MKLKKFNESSTSKKKLVIQKGYTLTVVSWENDGDNYNTNTKTVETIEEAEAIYKLMNLCRSRNSAAKGLGNSGNFSNEQKQMIRDFLKENPVLVYEFYKHNDTETYLLSCQQFENGEIDDSELLDVFYEITYDLLGSSEYYACRVMESCSVTYSPEDIYLEEIKF